MARPRKLQPNRDSESEHSSQAVIVDDDAQRRARFEGRRLQMLEGLHVIEDIVKRRVTAGMVKHFLYLRETLIGMKERVNRNDLPDAYLRILLNDARLDALIFLSRLKVGMLYEHQRLLAPTEKLRSEIETSIERFLNDESGSMVRAGLDIEQELTILKHDFETLAWAENLIRDQESEPWWTSSTGGEKKLNLPSEK